MITTLKQTLKAITLVDSGTIMYVVDAQLSHDAFQSTKFTYPVDDYVATLEETFASPSMNDMVRHLNYLSEDRVMLGNFVSEDNMHAHSDAETSREAMAYSETNRYIVSPHIVLTLAAASMLPNFAELQADKVSAVLGYVTYTVHLNELVRLYPAPPVKM